MSILARAWSQVVSRSMTIVTKTNARNARASGPTTDPGRPMMGAASTCIEASPVRIVVMKTVILLRVIRDCRIWGEDGNVLFPCVLSVLMREQVAPAWGPCFRDFNGGYRGERSSSWSQSGSLDKQGGGKGLGAVLPEGW